MVRQEKFGLTLVQKGLALIVVPFLFNCAWLFILSGVLDKTNRLAEMEREQTLYIERLNAVMDCSYQYRESLLGYISTKRKKYLARTDQWINRTTAALSQLKSLPHLSTEQRTLAGELDEVLNGQLGQIRSLLKSGDDKSTDGLIQDLEGLRETIGQVLSGNIDISSHVLKQRSDLDSARRVLQDNNSKARTIVISGFCGNLLLTIILVLLLNRSLNTRLRMLVENAQRLPKRQQLNAPLTGADELAYLDTSLHHASDELQRASEFRASLMQMVAHDLRSPLFSCQISLEIILDRENRNLSTQGQQQIKAMQNSLERLIALVNDLLLVEQYESDQLSLDINAENIKEVIDQAIASVAGAAEAKKIMIKNMAAQEYVAIDRNRIMQVIINYLANAIKFSPDTSVIEISTELTAGKLKVSVRDHGCGISAADKHKLFQKFFQTDEGKNAGGAGLGLAICKSIIKAHGGDVGLASEVGKGAIFWFSLTMAK